jgi:hypothetical protein
LGVSDEAMNKLMEAFSTEEGKNSSIFFFIPNKKNTKCK